MGTSVERTANHTDIWKLGLGYEMPCGPVDGMNPVKVAEAMTEAIDRARRGDGPTFLEMSTVIEDTLCQMHNCTVLKKSRRIQKNRSITQVLDVIWITNMLQKRN
jgi:pyruvate dehydrogenase E1 component alpha subunit